MKCVAVVVLLNLLSLGHSAPLSSCDSLVKPITISNEDMLGRWLHVGGSSDMPGSRFLGHLTTGIWLDITASTQTNTVKVLQTQKTFGQCIRFTYNVTFEKGTMLVEQPFLLKGTLLPTNCLDCLVIYDHATFDKDTFTNLQLYSRKKCVSLDVLEMFKRQAECLRMPSPIMMDTDYEICTRDSFPSGGLITYLSILDVKMGSPVARTLDALFASIVN